MTIKSLSQESKKFSEITKEYEIGD